LRRLSRSTLDPALRPTKNRENVLVNWGQSDAGRGLLKHFDRNYAQAKVYAQGY
jgi:hypothetical protein